MQTKPTSAYVHIPFCTQICYYCDFSKAFIKNQPVDDYLRALIREWELSDIKELRTLYIGGGTPTAISAEQLDYLLSNLQKNLDLSKLEEFTIEANPGDLTVDKIEVLKKSAVNRVSLGVQTFDDKHLRQIGRSHNQAQIYESINSLKSAGFHNLCSAWSNYGPSQGKCEKGTGTGYSTSKSLQFDIGTSHGLYE